MRPHNHVLVFNQLTQYLQYLASLLPVAQLFALGLASNSQTEVHQKRRGILQAVLSDGLVFFPECRNYPFNHVEINHYCLSITSEWELLQRAKGILPEAGIIVLLGIEDVDKRLDDIFPLEKIASPKILWGQGVNENDQEFFDAARIGFRNHLMENRIRWINKFQL